VRFVRSVQDARRPVEELAGGPRAALDADLQRCVDDNVALYARAPRPAFTNAAEKLSHRRLNLVPAVHASAVPGFRTAYNFYVFSAIPSGLGHGTR